MVQSTWSRVASESTRPWKHLVRILDNLFDILESNPWFTKGLTESRFHAIPMMRVNFRDLADYLEDVNMSLKKKGQVPFTSIVGFVPTGWTGATSRTRIKKNVVVHSVPYSEHSSFKELRACIRALCKSGLLEIIPTVSAMNASEVVRCRSHFADLMAGENDDDSDDVIAVAAPATTTPGDDADDPIVILTPPS